MHAGLSKFLTEFNRIPHPKAFPRLIGIKCYSALTLYSYHLPVRKRMRGLLVETARKIVRGLYHTPLIGKLLNAIAKEREHVNVMDVESRLRGSGLSTLKYGPFAGMQYPQLNHYGYASLPMKFLGTYERELHAAIGQSLKRGYGMILNIGAADGYYACGYALMLPKAKVIAWEMVPFIAGLLRQLAVANGVIDRIDIRGFCKPEELKSVASKTHTLIFSDCEGAEIELLTFENLNGFVTYDMIIECHDHLVDNATAILMDRFRSTHDIQVVHSASLVMDDVPSAGIVAAGGPTIALYRSLEENRLFAMRWIVAFDKRVSSQTAPSELR